MRVRWWWWCGADCACAEHLTCTQHHGSSHAPDTLGTWHTSDHWPHTGAVDRGELWMVEEVQRRLSVMRWQWSVSPLQHPTPDTCKDLRMFEPTASQSTTNFPMDRKIGSCILFIYVNYFFIEKWFLINSSVKWIYCNQCQWCCCNQLWNSTTYIWSSFQSCLFCHW